MADNKQKTKMDILKSLRKNFGNDSVLSGDSVVMGNVDPIPTGSYTLDNAIGIGGIPRGRITQFAGASRSGKTFMALQCVKAWQQMNEGNYALWFDAEFSFEPSWAHKLGVNMDNLDVIRENNGAKIFTGLCGSPHPKTGKIVGGTINELIEAHGKDSGCGLIVLDSIACLVPPVEAAYDVGHQNMAPLARFLPAALRAVAPLLEKANIAMIFINQIRVDPGVKYGCFHEDTPVMMADGSQVSIRKVVEDKLEGPVLSFDGNSIVERKIIDWHYNGKLGDNENWLTFGVEGTGGPSGNMGFTCTSNHILVNGAGEEVAASTIKVGDTLMSWYQSVLSTEEREIIIGSMFGDGHLENVGNSSACLKLANSEQNEYLMWKIKSLKGLDFARVASYGDYGERIKYRSNSSFELGLLRDEFYLDLDKDDVAQKNYRTIPLNLLDNASKRTLAVWYMDDGAYKETHRNASISVKRLSAEYGRNVAHILCKKYPGISFSETQKAIIIPTDVFTKFSFDIASYVIPIMAYKLLPEHRKLASDFINTNKHQYKRILCPGTVFSIKYSERKHRSRHKYDLTIENNSFYLVGGDRRGVVVHNSPETSPGGNGLKHAEHLMVNFNKSNAAEKRIENKKGDPIGHTILTRIDKNRVGLPGRQVEIRIKYLEGVVDHNIEMLELGTGYGLIQRPNNRTYIYKDNKWTSKDDVLNGLANVEVIKQLLVDVNAARMSGLAFNDNAELEEEENE